MSGGQAGCPGSKSEDELEELDVGAEIDDFKGKFGEISWMECGENWGKARSTRNQAKPWIKINKTSSNPQITKKIGAIFGGDFRIYDEIKQKKARKRWGRLRNRDQHGSDTKMM